MNRIRGSMGVIPPLLAGAAVAGAAEMSAGLLLYSTDGFLPALTLVLTVETGALALGLWTGGFRLGGEAVEQVRRRWLFALVTFAVAAAFSTGMTFMEELLTGGLGQGLGLALLGSLPLFALGSLLGAMAQPGSSARVPTAAIGVPSLVGLALGFLLTGGLLMPNMAPYTFYLVFLTALSGGALLQGWVLEDRPIVAVLGRQGGEGGEVRVEDHFPGVSGQGKRVLLEGGRLRGAEDSGGFPARNWERAVLGGLFGSARGPGPVLYLGGGSGTLARRVRHDSPENPVVVVERSPALLELARAHFRSWENLESVDLKVGEPWSVVTGLDGPFPLVIVDVGLLPALGGLPWVQEGDWRKLAASTGPGGRVVLGGLDGTASSQGPPLQPMLEDAMIQFSTGALYQAEEGGDDDFILVLEGPEALPWGGVLPGYRRLTMRET